jgi:transcription termination/antitermination protein NusA
MKSEFALAFNQICSEYNLPREVVLDAIRAALVTAYRRDSKVSPTQNVSAEINLSTGLARIHIEKEIVESVDDPIAQISLKKARRIKPDVELEETVMVDDTPKDFGRIAAQTAKQVITQRLREAERESQFNRFSRQENEIIIGTVQSVSPRGVTLHLERTEEAHMPRREQIPGERYVLHQKIRAYVLQVRRTSRGPNIIVSRSHPLMLRRLLELEVPEVRAGQVEINAVAREAGTRAKIAVSATQTGIDPVGACVGMRGIRIQTISRELHDERIDVLEYSEDPATFISNALSVPVILCVTLDENNPNGRTASVVVLDQHLSLAIGRSGQNARLAAKLTNWRVDIQGATEAGFWALEQINKTPELLDDLGNRAALLPKLASVMRSHEEDRYPYTDEERRLIGETVKSIREVAIARRDAERPGAQQARERRHAQRRVEAARVEAKREARERVPKAAYNTPLSELELAPKIYSNLISDGLSNVGELMERMALGDEALLMLNGVGVKALGDIKEGIAASGWELRSIEEEEREAVEAPELETVEEVEELVEDLMPAETELAVEEEEEAPEVEPVVEPAVEEEVVAVEAAEPEAVEKEEAAEPADVEAVVEEAVEPEPEVVEPEAVEEEEEEEELPVIELVTEKTEEEEDDVFADLVDDYTEVLSKDEYVYDERPFIDEEEDEEEKTSGKKARRRAVFYDEETGETFVVHKHRHDDEEAWDEYGDY